MRVLDVATLAQWVEAAPVNDSAQVGPDVVIDTRKVTPGALFIACLLYTSDAADE